MAKASKTVRSSKLKKRWISIIAPKMFNNQVIGETVVYDPQKTIGKTIFVSLANLTRDIKRQNIHVLFKVNSATGEKASTEVIGYEFSPSHIKRMVRRSKDRIDQSFIAETADNIKVRLKLILLTRNFTKASVLTDLRKACEDSLKKIVKKMKYEDLTIDIINHKVQSNLKRQLGKIYPLQVCEIRFMKIEKEKKHGKEKSKKESAEKKAAKEMPAQEEKE